MPDLPEWIYRQRLQVGDRLRALRAARDLSQEALAHAAGLDRKTVNRIETGARSITGDQAAVLARVLRVPTFWLFTDEWHTETCQRRPGPGAGA